MTERFEGRAEQGALREALFYALECIGDNLDILGTEWADRPMKEWYAEWKAALAAQPANTVPQVDNNMGLVDYHPQLSKLSPSPLRANTVPGAGQRDSTGFFTYAHMCRDGHEQIGHNDSEHEMCPLCRALAQPRDLVDAAPGENK
jgi:hypothetical protein